MRFENWLHYVRGPTCWPGSKNIRGQLHKIHAFSQVSQIYRVIFLTMARSATRARRRTFCSGVSRMKRLTGINKRGWQTTCTTAGDCCVVRISKPVVVLQSGHIHTWNRVHLSWKKYDNHSEQWCGNLHDNFSLKVTVWLSCYKFIEATMCKTQALNENNRWPFIAFSWGATPCHALGTIS